jgi:hypothetical protein
MSNYSQPAAFVFSIVLATTGSTIAYINYQSTKVQPTPDPLPTITFTPILKPSWSITPFPTPTPTATTSLLQELCEKERRENWNKLLKGEHPSPSFLCKESK